MATASNKNLEEQDVASSSKKPRRSVIRSISWKRSKKTKMDDVDNDQAIDEAVQVDAGRSFGKRGGAHAMSADEDEEISELDGTGPSSKKRKRFGVWKAMKRIFRKKNGKGSKSFTEGDSNSPHAPPQRSISDPNLISRTEDRPELAPLEQVHFSPPVAEAETSFPKKALSHDSLMLELRSKQGKGTPPIKPKKPAVVSPEAQAFNWQVSSSSNPERLLPGLNVSHDKIRVAPRHRRAPTRRGVASVRHGGRDITDGNIIPRSKSVGAASQANVVTKPQETTDFKELKQSLRSREQLTFETKKHEIIEEAIPEGSKVEKKMEKIESVSDDNDISESSERDIAAEESHVSWNKEFKITKGEESAKEDKISDMEIVPVVFEVGTAEKQTEVLDKVDDQETAEEALKELKYSEHEPVPLSTTNSETDFSDSDGVVGFSVAVSEVVKSKSETVAEPDRELMRERTAENKDDTGMPSATTMETVSNKDDESVVKVVAELNPVELVEPEPESESAPKLALEREQKPESELEAKPAPEAALEPATEPEQDHESEPEPEPEPEPKPAPEPVPEPATEPEQDHESERDHEPEPEPEPKPELEPEPEQEREPELEPKPEPKFEPVLEIISGTGREGSIESILKPTVPAPPEPISAPVPAEDLDKTLAQARPKVESKQEIDPRFSCDQETSESNLSLATHDVNVEKPKSPEVVKTSPVRSKRLKIETPEKVFQKPIMMELRIKENEDEEKSDERGGVQRRRIQSVNARTITRVEEDRSKDDSSAGVARLTQAFERSARSNTISFGERRKRPDVFPKPKIPPAKAEDTMNDKTRSLGRNYRFPVTAKKSLETSPKENMAQAAVNRSDDSVEIVDKVSSEPNEITEKSKTVLMSPTKKPKTLPKPKMNKEAKPDGKENVKGESMSKPIRNGNAKVSEREEKKDGTPEAAMPSFWARRNIFSPNLAAENSTTDLTSPGSPEKTKTKEVVKPLIQLKTDTCAVCGSKVYQMEKFKVKDNIVHRNCIKCSVCKRLLSVGNFIMSKNKIYCKPHEPRIAITLTT